jgi:hypothetical protein
VRGAATQRCGPPQMWASRCRVALATNTGAGGGRGYVLAVRLARA